MWTTGLVGVVSFALKPSSLTVPIHRQSTKMAATVTAAASKRLIGKISPNSSALLLCDIQDRFRSVIHNSETVINNSRLLTSACKVLDIPIIVTEQYPKAFGHTVKECFEESSDLENIPVFPKTLFSMMTPEVTEHIGTLNASSFIITGIEAHVCVQQTALDLLELGHDVHIIADACSSQRSYDREIALKRMADAGAYVTTSQSVIFMLMQGAKHPKFKDISKLVVENMKLENEFEK